MCKLIQNLKRWWILRKAKKLEKEAVPDDSAIGKEDQDFNKEAAELANIVSTDMPKQKKDAGRIKKRSKKAKKPKKAGKNRKK